MTARVAAASLSQNFMKCVFSSIESSVAPLESLSRLVHPDFCLLRAAIRHGKVQPALFADEQRCSRTGGRHDESQAAEAVRVLTVQHVEEAFTPADVQPLPRRIEEEIVSIADDIEGTHLLATGGVVHEHLGRTPAADEEPMGRFVE